MALLGSGWVAFRTASLNLHRPASPFPPCSVPELGRGGHPDGRTLEERGQDVGRHG